MNVLAVTMVTTRTNLNKDSVEMFVYKEAHAAIEDAKRILSSLQARQGAYYRVQVYHPVLSPLNNQFKLALPDERGFIYSASSEL